MECPQCFYSKDASVDDKRCRICGRGYRPSVNVYLGLVALLYLVFVRYFAVTLTGAPLSDIKVRPPSSLTSAFLALWARDPVDIQFRPELILILGGMLALLVLVPVAMSILYGKRGGFLLATIALLLGPSIWLALPLFLSVWIAGGRTLRMTSKVASALLACAPVWVFYLLYSRAPGSLPLPSAYYMPALAAVVISAVLIVTLLPTLRFLRWNARWAGIVLCILCALPIVGYKVVIGEDEVAYSRLARDYGLKSSRFESISGAAVVEQLDKRLRDQEESERKEAEEKEKEEKLRAKKEGWDEGDPSRRNVIPPVVEDERMIRQGRLNNLKIQFAAELEQTVAKRKQETIEQCRAFLAEYPGSRHRVDVLYTMIWAGDMQVDTSALRLEDPANLPIRFDSSRLRGLGGVKGSADQPADSRQLCEELLRDYPDSPYAIEAMVKLADHQARSGNIAAAVAGYDQVLARYGSQVDAPGDHLENLSLLGNLLDVGERRQEQERQQRIDSWFRIAEREHAFLVENSDCPHCRNAQLMAYLSIPVFEVARIREDDLRKILAACPQCKLADNVAYELALLQASIQKRMDALADVPQRYPGSDGAAQALFELARIERNLEGNAIDKLRLALDRYQQIEREYPKSHLARQARIEAVKLEADLRKVMTGPKGGAGGR